MKGLLLVIFMMTFFSMKSYSQVLTRYLSNEQKTEDIIYFPLKDDITYYMQPRVDFDKVLEDDRKTGQTIPRFAVRVDQNYTANDGEWERLGKLMLWHIGFSAPDAASLNFLISDLRLPKSAEMYILSKSGRMIHGPITSEVIYNNTYASDVIESQDVRIVVKCKQEDYQQFSIKIFGVCQGIPNALEVRDFGDAADCNIDVNCPQGAGWEDERDAVALVLKNGDEHCSGSLLNNQCQDLRSFFLTAFHCFDTNKNKILEGSGDGDEEKDLSLYAFRFKYEAGTPTCPGNSTGNQGTWIVYSGANFRAANNATDFALAELYGGIKNQPNITLAGWDRNQINTLNSTCIHHPSGDAKKISFDENPNVISGNFHEVIWDAGTTERGSSGSPLFNNQKRIIGQLFSGTASCFNPTGYDHFGRFDLSWTGGGSNDTRLSNWLGGTNPPNTVNTIRSPSVNATGVISPSNEFLICTTNKQFLLSNPIPGSTITWSVSNPGLFATTGGASTSGSGTSATLRAASSSSSGNSILTFIMSQTGCSDVVITRQIWVGKPDFGLDYIDNICIGDLEFASINLYGSYNTSLGSISWSFSGSITGTGSTATARYRGVSAGWGNICITATNGCGTTTKCFWVYVDDCRYYRSNSTADESENNKRDRLMEVLLSPNPFKDILSVRIGNFDNNAESELSIYTINGTKIESRKVEENSIDINMSGYLPGVYLIHFKTKNQLITQKVIKQ